MQLLVTKENYILFAANRIVYGTYEEEDKWALYDENGYDFLYVLDNHYRVIDFNGELPEDIYEYGKYLWDDEQASIVTNPDWRLAEDDSIEHQVAALSEALDDLMTNVIPMLMEG